MTHSSENFHTIDTAEKRCFVDEVERLMPLMDLYDHDVEQEESEAADVPEGWSVHEGFFEMGDGQYWLNIAHNNRTPGTHYWSVEWADQSDFQETAGILTIVTQVCAVYEIPEIHDATFFQKTYRQDPGEDTPEHVPSSRDSKVSFLLLDLIQADRITSKQLIDELLASNQQTKELAIQLGEPEPHVFTKGHFREIMPRLRLLDEEYLAPNDGDD